MINIYSSWIMYEEVTTTRLEILYKILQQLPIFRTQLLKKEILSGKSKSRSHEIFCRESYMYEGQYLVNFIKIDGYAHRRLIEIKNQNLTTILANKVVLITYDELLESITKEILKYNEGI